eukprot:TRINITY_DN1782_c0_g2_i1.p1 TRINITY_DN1782_c0_g2~~TRINITY_DN1782_c0_g2_i1.p1  ORF type:complete len:634 (-),score=124.07 TRINITY_DN1782_c0_g2_i1:37-1938(-)
MSEIVRDKTEDNILPSAEVPPKKQTPKWAQKLELTGLPRLPIPDLKVTLAKYIEYVTPLLSEAELEETKKKVQEFAKYDGPSLDAGLRELAKEAPTSWLEGFWDTMYLSWRDPIAIHINPCFVFTNDPTPSRNKRVPRAASMIFSIHYFINLLRAGHLARDYERSDPLCMSQYANLFGSTRIPQFTRDKMVVDHEATHVAVVCNDRYYTFELVDGDKRPLEIEQIEQLLHRVVEDAKSQEKDIAPLGMMTAADRETWAGVWNRLISVSPKNKEYLDKLCSSMFMVCLDDNLPMNLEETGKIMLHSDGHNRWFDKSIQLIVCENGRAGINMEHSGFDGHTCLRFAEDVFNYSVRTRCDSPSTFTDGAVDMGNTSTIQRLDFVMPDDVISAIDRATVDFQALASSLHTGILHFTPYGKSFISRYKLSPDGLVQVCFQLSQYRLTGKLGSTYESAMTKKFYHGRTECMRPITNEMADLMKIISDPSSVAIEQLKVLKTAIKAHVTRVQASKAGEGVDRHLWGLNQLAKQRQVRLPGYNIPDIFQDIAWARLRYDVLSTSNCGGYSLSSFGFGPVVPDGWGIGYIIKDKCMHFHVTNYNEEMCRQFVEQVEKALIDVGKLITNGEPIRIVADSNAKL